MANIMLTDVCNLKCPYCFANEFVNHDKNEITMENFKKGLDFILTKRGERVGLIGGEPTLHSQFRDILRILIGDDRVSQSIVFTNGIMVDKFLNELANPKFRILVNCNSPGDIGEKNFKKVEENIERMIRERYMKDRLTLGINMYKEDFEYDFMIDLLNRYHFSSVRVSVTVPDVKAMPKETVFDYFMRMKPRVVDFFMELLENGIEPLYDCNKIPACLMEEEMELFKRNAEKLKDRNRSPKSIFVRDVRCTPVIDITPDLRAVRCFGLSGDTKVDIGNFRSLEELYHYYQQTVDCYAYGTAADPRCSACYERETQHCMGGCLVFKYDKIKKMQQFSRELMNEDA